MTWPLEPMGLEQALGGLDRVLVVEEKRGLIEGQAKELLYHLPRRPVIEGKLDEAGATAPAQPRQPVLEPGRHRHRRAPARPPR